MLGRRGSKNRDLNDKDSSVFPESSYASKSEAISLRIP